MTVNHHEFNQVMIPITAVVPDLVSLPEQINTALVFGMQLLTSLSLFANMQGPPEELPFRW